MHYNSNTTKIVTIIITVKTIYCSIKILLLLTPTFRRRSPTIFIAATLDDGVIALPLTSPENITHVPFVHIFS